MSFTDLPALRAGPLRLALLEEGPGSAHVLCEGEVCFPYFTEGGDPLAQLVGPDVYARRVLLNMERVSYLDTSGVSWLLAARRRCESAGGALALHSVPPRVRYVLELLHLEQALPAAPDAAAGRALLEGNKV